MIFHFKPNVFPNAFTFHFGPFDHGALLAAYRKAGYDDPHGLLAPPVAHYSGMAMYPDPAAPVLWMESVPHSPKEIGTLVHELSHVVLRYVNDLGMDHGRATTEVYAYLLDALTTAVLEKVWHGINRPGIYEPYTANENA